MKLNELGKRRIARVVRPRRTPAAAICVCALFFAFGARAIAIDFLVTEWADINPGVIADPTPRQRDSSPRFLTSLGNQLYFAATDPSGRRLYRTEGATVASVGLIEDPTYLTQFDNAVYMSGFIDEQTELIRAASSGVSVLDVAPGDASSDPIRFNEFNGNLYFVATGPLGRELHRTDGVTVTPLADISPRELPFFEPNDFTVFNGNLYFTVDGEFGNELYRTDGASVTLVADIRAGSISSHPDWLTVVGDDLFFTAGDSASRQQIYRTTGTGAIKVSDFPSLAAVDHPRALFGFREKLYFSVARELYTNDGHDVSLLGWAQPDFFTIYQDQMIFAAFDDAHDRRLYRSDGTTITAIGTDIRYSVKSPLSYFEYQGELYFFGREFVAGTSFHGLFKTNGTSVTRLSEIELDASYPFFFEFADQLFFRAEGPSGLELYRTDGQQVFLVSDINPMGGSDASEFIQVGSRVFFNATGPHGNELYALSLVAEPTSSALLMAAAALACLRRRARNRRPLAAA
jgi:ELWxxDGT repeat protein